MTVRALRISTVSFVIVGFNVFASSFFTALNDGGVSAAISFLRTFVFPWLSPIVHGIALFDLPAYRNTDVYCDTKQDFDGGSGAFPSHFIIVYFAGCECI